MTDSKKQTREQILGELESIQQLLNEDELPEPPLLTETEAPLLTETVDDKEADWKPPVLREALADEAIPHPSHSPHSLELELELAKPAAPAQRPADGDAAQQAPAAPQPDASSSSVAVEEQQPGLFDPGAESPSAEDAPQSAESPKQRADTEHGTPLPKSENPFLPKHIRDRLTANRLLQAELVKGLDQTPAHAPAKVSDQAVEALVDELVQRFLPQMEAELRRRLRELAAEAAEDDPPAG